MSAWTISENHVRVIVQSLYKYSVLEFRAKDIPYSPIKLGQLLWEENYRSVNHRYQGEYETPHYTQGSTAVCRYEGTPIGTVWEVTRQPIVVLKLVRCYVYQSCEHPTWEASAACALTEVLSIVLHTVLGCADGEAVKLAAYDAAPWSIN